MLFRIKDDPIFSKSEISKDLGLLHPIAMYEELFWYAKLAQSEGYKVPKEFGDLRNIEFFKVWWYQREAWKLFSVVTVEQPIKIVRLVTNPLIQINRLADKKDVLTAIEEYLDKGEITEKEQDDTSLFPINKVGNMYTFKDEDYKTFYAPLRNLSGDKLAKKVEELGATEGVIGFLATWGRLAAFRAAYKAFLAYQGDELQAVKAAHSLGYFSEIRNVEAKDVLEYAAARNAYNKTKTKRNLDVSSTKKETRNNDPLFNTLEKQKKADKKATEAELQKSAKEEEQRYLKANLDEIEKSLGKNNVENLEIAIRKSIEKIKSQRNKCVETFIGIGAKPFSFPVKNEGGASKYMKANIRKPYEEEAAERKAAGKIEFS